MQNLTEPGAVEAAYRRHGGAVLRRARELLRNDHDARELVQEIFLSLLDRPEQFGGQSSLTTWLYSVTTHRCLNRLRDRKNRARLVQERALPTRLASDSPSAERLTLLSELLARLPDDLAQVAVYHYLDEMTHEEIARVIGCSRRHVGDLLQRMHDATRTEVEACRAL